MRRRRWTQFSLAIALLIVLGGVGLYAVGWQLSRPVPARIGPAPPALHAASVSFRSESGSTIHGWLSPGTTGRGVILLLPGIRSNRLAMVGRAEMLRSAGYSSLSIDFQATGESPGDLITFGWRERLDVQAAVVFLDGEMPDEPIGIIGVSLGGAATVLAEAIDVRGVVLEAVYPSLDVAIENRIRIRLGPLAKVLSPLLILQVGPRLGVPAATLAPVDHIARLGCPVLVIGGTEDQHTTLADTERLYAAARAPKELWLVPHASHTDYAEVASAEYQRRIINFFDHALGATSGRP